MTELVSPEQHSAEAMAEQSNRQVTKLDTAFRQSSQEVAKVSGYCSCIVYCLTMAHSLLPGKRHNTETAIRAEKFKIKGQILMCPAHLLTCMLLVVM